MNNSFDWNRFGKLLRRDFRAIWPNFGLTMLIITILPLAAWLFMLSVDVDEAIAPEFRWFMILGCVSLSACMAPSRLYKTSNLPNRGIHFAMLPASKREKFWSMLFYSVLVCPAMVFVGGVLFDFLLSALPFGPYRQWLFESGAWLNGESLWDVLMKSEYNSFPVRSLGLLLLMMASSYLFGASTFFFSATLFRKHKVLLTFIAMWLISFVCSLFVMPVVTLLTANNPEILTRIAEILAMQGTWYGYVVLYVLGSLLLLWWSGRRLRNMKY